VAPSLGSFVPTPSEAAVLTSVGGTCYSMFNCRSCSPDSMAQCQYRGWIVAVTAWHSASTVGGSWLLQHGTVLIPWADRGCYSMAQCQYRARIVAVTAWHSASTVGGLWLLQHGTVPVLWADCGCYSMAQCQYHGRFVAVTA
jgi:hypothetical protein